MHHFSARETAWLQELDGIELAGFRRRALAFLIDWTIVGILLLFLAGMGGALFFTAARLSGHPIHIKKLDLDKANITFDDKDTKTDDAGDSSDADISKQASTAPKTHIHYQAGLPSEGEEDAKLPRTQRFIKKIGDLASDVVVPTLYFGILLWRGKGQTPGKRWMKIRVVSIVHPHLSFWHSVERALGYGAAALEAGFGFFQFWIHPYRRCAQDRLAETIVVTERSYQEMLVTRGSVKS